MLYTYESGNPEDETILFLHAGGLSGKSWLPVIERLPEFYCLAPDLPEQGRSRGIPYTISGSASGAAEVLRQRAPGKQVHVVALSLGGPVAFTLLRTAPELVKSTLISGGSGKVSKFASWLGKNSIWMYKFFKMDYLIRETKRQHGVADEYADLVQDDFVAAMSPDFMRHYMSELSLWELPGEIHTPLLLVVGEQEVKAAYGFARDFLKKYPAALGAVALKAKHAWSLQYPDLFAAMVRAWVTGQPLPEGFKPLK